jgi:hypothetical protein
MSYWDQFTGGGSSPKPKTKPRSGGIGARNWNPPTGPARGQQRRSSGPSNYNPPTGPAQRQQQRPSSGPGPRGEPVAAPAPRNLLKEFGQWWWNGGKQPAGAAQETLSAPPQNETIWQRWWNGGASDRQPGSAEDEAAGEFGSYNLFQQMHDPTPAGQQPAGTRTSAQWNPYQSFADLAQVNAQRRRTLRQQTEQLAKSRGWKAYGNRLSAQAYDYQSRPVGPAPVVDNGGGYGYGWGDWGWGGGGGGGGYPQYEDVGNWFNQMVQWNINRPNPG